MTKQLADGRKTEKRKKAVKIAKLCGFVLLCCVLALLLINSLLCIFAEHYYPTYGKYRLFAIVSDSMEPEIPTGNMIVCTVPKDESEIEVGTVITYEWKRGNSTILNTHRVTQVHTDEVSGVVSYTTQGDNAPAADAVRPTFSNVVGIYTGNRCPVLGYVAGFLQSTEGAIALIIIALIAIFAYIMVWYVNKIQVWRSTAVNALEKVRKVLLSTHVEELKTIADVVGITTKDPEDKKELKRKDQKLQWFMMTGSLPKHPYRDDLCTTDAMSNNIEDKIKYLVYNEELAQSEAADGKKPAQDGEVVDGKATDDVNQEKEDKT